MFPCQENSGHAPSSVVVRRDYLAAFALVLQIVKEKATVVQITTPCVKVKKSFDHTQVLLGCIQVCMQLSFTYTSQRSAFCSLHEMNEAQTSVIRIFKSAYY